MSGFWTVDRPRFTVEKRKIEGRHSQRRAKDRARPADRKDEKPAAPLADEVSKALRSGRFPKDWLKGGGSTWLGQDESERSTRPEGRAERS